MRISVLILLFIVVVENVFANEEPIVSTIAGKVRGVKQRSVEGDEFYGFKGIPYAKPPIGELRFKDSEPADPWTDVRDATSYGAICTQVSTITNQVSGVEDCLYLNVFTRSVDNQARRPVMFWIHGGFFLWGSADDAIYGPEYLMRKDIVLVTVNYRLGIFGFLNVDDELATGNQGLKDQLLALEWVRDNIANFGGDPDRVTIFGQSAGSASVHHLTLSPLAKNLFSKAIAQSGVSLNSWTFQTNPKESAFQLCELLGHEGKEPKSAVKFLKTIDAQKMIKTHKQMLTKEDKIQVVLHFGPSVDSQSKSPFMPVHPEVAAARGVHVPLMIGHTNAEGIILYKNVATNYDRFNKEFDQLMHPEVANVMKKYGLTIEDLKRIYFANDSVTKANLDQLIQLLGDMHFVEGVQRVVEIQMEKSTMPTYFYRFTYDKEQSLLKTIFNAQIGGACHADDLFFLFRAKMIEGKRKYPENGSEQYRIMEQMVEMWVNFATTGVPVPKQSELLPFDWQPLDNRTSGLRGLNICEDTRVEDVTTLRQKYIT